MPYKISKLPRGCYEVKNIRTKKIVSKCTSKAKAKSQVRLLERLDKYNK